MELRWLTPREVGRLQGFCDDYKIDMITEKQAYFIFGNAVSVPVAKAMAERIRMFLLSL
jgi:site-specific DNA-cytosine methylase